MESWVRERATDLQSTLRAIASSLADTVADWDICDDNLLQRSDSSIVFVDWGQASLGHPWTDPLLSRVERVETPWLDVSVRRCPPLAGVGEAAVTACTCGFAVSMPRAKFAVEVSLPGLHALRRRESARMLVGTSRRVGEA